MRWSCRVLIGFIAQSVLETANRRERITPPCWCLSFHHARSRVSRSAGSMALRYHEHLFATLDPDQCCALAVDVGYLERCDLGHAQASAIGDRESRLMLEAGGRVEQSCNLVPAQHHGQVARMRGPDRLACQVRPVNRVCGRRTATPRRCCSWSASARRHRAVRSRTGARLPPLQYQVSAAGTQEPSELGRR